MGTRKSPLWRRVFLRALARTGNVSVSAAEAGVEPETAHRHRRKDERFAALWAAALPKGKAAAEKARSRRRSRGAGELVLRRTRTGAKLVRATPGRWCKQAEDAFFAELAASSCVQSAAAAAGLSAAAIYKRRDHYPEFAERWRAVEEAAAERLPSLLRAAGIASMDPDAAMGTRRGLPKVNVDQAIAISRLKGSGGGGGNGAKRPRGGIGPKLPGEEEVNAEIMRLVKVLRRRNLKQGWTLTEEGHMIPPGWVRAGREGGGEGG